LPTPLIIAIDGPAASGKGTLARRLAAHLGLRHFDTGLSYRAVAHALLEAGLPLDNEKLAVAAARKIQTAKLDAKALAAHGIGAAASRVAVMPGVRRVLVAAQRKFGAVPPGAVLDGRDIGTVVFPDADAKLYVTASPLVRARRRYDEIIANGGSADLAAILADIEARDARDMGRADSPLRPAADAHLLDTSTMDIETAFRAALEIVERSGLRGTAQPQPQSRGR
jgi:cytidylate kinase